MKAALIPLRGGSKGIPRKNVRMLAGRPLCGWVLKAAKESNLFDTIAVSTDNAEISAIVRGLDPNIVVIDRPAELATDTATTDAVMLHAIEHLNCDLLCTIQATSPLLTGTHLRGAMEQFQRDSCDSMLSGVLTKHFHWSLAGEPLNYDPERRPMRQQFEGSVTENGAFYFTRRKILQEKRCRLGGKIGIYLMPGEFSVELDEPADWNAIAAILERRP